MNIYAYARIGDTHRGTFRQGNPRQTAWEMVTQGLKCPPDAGPATATAITIPSAYPRPTVNSAVGHGQIPAANEAGFFIHPRPGCLLIVAMLNAAFAPTPRYT
jgi:hypothetical protein